MATFTDPITKKITKTTTPADSFAQITGQADAQQAQPVTYDPLQAQVQSTPVVAPVAAPVSKPVESWEDYMARKAVDPNAPVDPPAVTPVTPVATTTTQNNGLFDPLLTQQYNGVVSDMLTGKSFDPMKAATQEGLARAEANERAKSAEQINRFGAVGQGIGNQMAQATESGIAANRFDQSVTLRQAEQDSKIAGLGAYNNAINTQQALNDLNADKTAEFSSYVQRSPDLKNATVASIAADQGLMNYGQGEWERQGGQGAVSADWVKKQVDRINDPALNNEYIIMSNDIDEAVSLGKFDEQTGNMMKMLISGVSDYIVDEKGNIVSKKEETEEPQVLSDEIANGKYTAAQIMDAKSPERLEAALSIAQEWKKNTNYSDGTQKFDSVPDKNVPFLYNGSYYMRTDDVQSLKIRGHRDEQQFTGVDIKTGEPYTWNSND